MANQPRKELAFFKFFDPETCTHRLKIPSEYRYQQGNIPTKVLLRDRYGNIWPVEVTKVENDLFFVVGWTKFARDNFVEMGDFLVFQFDGNNMFQVVLLGHTSCEKKGVGGLISEVHEQEKASEKEEVEFLVMEEEEKHESLDIISGAEIAKDKRGCKRPRNTDGAEISKSRLISPPRNPYFVSKMRRKRREELVVLPGHSSCEKEGFGALISAVHEEEKASGKEEVEIMEMEEEEYELVDISSADDSDNDYINEEVQKVEKRHESLDMSIGHGGTEIPQRKRGYNGPQNTHGTEIFTSGNISIPGNPHFVAKTRRKRRDGLYIPTDILEIYNHDLPSKMIMRDSCGREWTGKLTRWKDGRVWYRGGWGSLCRVNLVQEDDRCICEVVKGNGDKGLYLQVHINYSGQPWFRKVP